MTESTLTFDLYSSFGRQVAVDVSRVTHWARTDYNGNPGVMIYLDTGREIHVADPRFDVGRRLVAAKDALLRARNPQPAGPTIDPVIAKVAAAVVRQLSLPPEHEALDRDLVLTVCTYVMEQSAP